MDRIGKTASRCNRSNIGTNQETSVKKWERDGWKSARQASCALEWTRLCLSWSMVINGDKEVGGRQGGIKVVIE